RAAEETKERRGEQVAHLRRGTVPLRDHWSGGAGLSQGKGQGQGGAVEGNDHPGGGVLRGLPVRRNGRTAGARHLRFGPPLGLTPKGPVHESDRRCQTPSIPPWFRWLGGPRRARAPLGRLPPRSPRSVPAGPGSPLVPAFPARWPPPRTRR